MLDVLQPFTNKTSFSKQGRKIVSEGLQEIVSEDIVSEGLQDAGGLRCPESHYSVHN